jgi:uncharacterized protein YegP (UPF0339 family)
MYAEIWQSPRDGLWYWHIRGANHEIVTHSEGYTLKAAALHALRLVFRGPIRDR